MEEKKEENIKDEGGVIEASSEKPAKEVPLGEDKKAVTKPISKASTKPVKKPDEPLVDNGDGTITDPNSGLIWKKTDAWIDTYKFYLWAGHREYVEKINTAKFAGFDSWRIPTKIEAASIFNKEKECIDKNGSVYYVDPIFEKGGVGNTWISECSEEKIIRYDFKTGVDTPYPPADIWASIRLVRKEGDPSNLPGSNGVDQPVEKTSEGQTKTDELGTAIGQNTTSAPNSPTPAGGVKKGPLKNKRPGGITDDERAEMLKNAKAHAANRKKA